MFIFKSPYSSAMALVLFFFFAASAPVYADPLSDTLKDLEQEAQVQELYAEASAWFYFEQYDKLPVSQEATQWANQISFAQQSSVFWHLIRFEIHGLLQEYKQIGKSLPKIEAVQSVLRNIVGQLLIAGRKSAHDLQISIARSENDKSTTGELFRSTLTRLNSDKLVSIKNENKFVKTLIEASQKPGYMESRFDLVQFYEESQSFKHFLNLLLPFLGETKTIQVQSWADALSHISNDQLLRRGKLCNMMMQYRKGISIEELSFGGSAVDKRVSELKNEITEIHLKPLSDLTKRLVAQAQKKQNDESPNQLLMIPIEYSEKELAELFLLMSEERTRDQFFRKFLAMGGARSNNKFGARLYLTALDKKTRVYFKINSRLWSSPRSMRHLLSAVLFEAGQGYFRSRQDVEEKAFGKILQQQQLVDLSPFLESDQFIELPSKEGAIGKTAVSQLFFYKVLKSNPSSFKAQAHCVDHHMNIAGTDICPFYPVERVQWKCTANKNSVQEFLRELNSLLIRNGAKFGFRLPTRAEYRWAAELNEAEKKLARDLFQTFWTETQPQKPQLLTAKPNHKGFYNSGVMEWTDETTEHEEGSHFVSCGSYSLIEGAYDDPPALNPEYSDSDIGFRLVKFFYETNAGSLKDVK